MRKLLLSSALSWALAFLLTPTAYAEEAAMTGDDYRTPVYDALELSAEGGEGKVYLKWSAFEGYRDETFEYYKVIRSYSDPNPMYPEDGFIKYFDGLGDLRFTDEKAEKGAYYRVCAITNRGANDPSGRFCSNVKWVEVKKAPARKCVDYSSTGSCEKYEDERECQNFAADGTCEEDHDKKKAEEWKKEQDEAKKRLEEKKKAEREAWEKQQDAKKKEYEAAKEKKRQEKDQEKEDRKAEIWEQLYAKLDTWLEKLHERLENSEMSNADKVAKIESIQERFYAWEKDNEMRMKMVDHLDEVLNDWKKKYSEQDDFDDLDNFLDGLLD